MKSFLAGALLGCGLAALLAAPAAAAIWPERVGSYARRSVKPIEVTADKALWEEYSLEEAEQAEYASRAGGKFTGIAYRFRDATSAFATFEWQRPARATPSKLGKLAVQTPGGALVAFGNHLFRFQGKVPEANELQELFSALPRLDQSPLPAWTDYLPTLELVPNSERYIAGPVSLERFEPRISPALAAFHFGVEAQMARYRGPGGEMPLVLFSYPTPHIARDRETEFQKLPGAVVKRTGPLVAVVLAPPDANAAEKLLSRIRYRAEITWSERVPTRRDNIGDLVINAFILIGFLLGFSLVGGLAFGGLQAAARRWLGWAPSNEAMITLDLTSKR